MKIEGMDDSANEGLNNLVITALAVGYDPTLGALELSLLACDVLNDQWLLDRITENSRVDLRAPGLPTHPDMVLWATLDSLSDSEKAALRARRECARNMELIS